MPIGSPKPWEHCHESNHAGWGAIARGGSGRARVRGIAYLDGLALGVGELALVAEAAPAGVAERPAHFFAVRHLEVVTKMGLCRNRNTLFLYTVSDFIPAHTFGC